MPVTVIHSYFFGENSIFTIRIYHHAIIVVTNISTAVSPQYGKTGPVCLYCRHLHHSIAMVNLPLYQLVHSIFIGR